MRADSNPPPPRPRGGLSLYANLLNADASAAAGTISRAPVVFSEGTGQQDDAASAQKQINAEAALRFQPTKRPQASAQKTKPKSTFTKVPSSTVESSSPDLTFKAAAIQSAPAFKSTIADWTGDDDDVNGFYAQEKRQRGGRKRRKKDREVEVVLQDWDDIYDPSRPNNYEDYKHSEEKLREVREWKDKLYAHRYARKRYSSDDSESDHERPRMNTTFGPPSSYSFAPPPSFEQKQTATETAPTPPSFPPTDLPDDPTGDDAYARRLRLSQIPPPSSTPPSPPPPPPSMPPKTVPSTPKTQPAGIISRAPVRYQLPAAPTELPASEAELEKAIAQEEEAAEEEGPRSMRPGQKGFAERLMSKYGWTEGSGLGAEGTGIVNPLRVQVEKRKKKSDAEGGGFVGPAGKGKIIGGKMNKLPQQEEGKYGAMSEVVVLRGMVDGMDLDAEVGEGGLMQEIGEECAEKYGRVERVFIHRACAEASIPVFIKFTSQLSALRAVNALEGRIFNGNLIQAKFFDADAFEKGTYE